MPVFFATASALKPPNCNVLQFIDECHHLSAVSFEAVARSCKEEINSDQFLTDQIRLKLPQYFSRYLWYHTQIGSNAN